MLRSHLSKRVLWSELEEVRQSGVLDVISANERALQETIFELLTSEASYNTSLTVLQDLVFASDQFTTYVGQKDTEILKSNLEQSRSIMTTMTNGLMTKHK